MEHYRQRQSLIEYYHCYLAQEESDLERDIALKERELENYSKWSYPILPLGSE